MTDCLFCAIADGRIPADVVAESDRVMVFRDVNPQAPVHLLSIPKAHFDDVGALADADSGLLAEVVALAVSAGIDAGVDNGQRIVFNTGVDGGQSVGHVHAHVLGGRRLTWPPG